MNTLREAVHDCIDMRRNPGFKMSDTRRALLAFVAFMESRKAAFVTVELALEWAQQPVHALPSHRARRLSHVRTFERHRKARRPGNPATAPSWQQAGRGKIDVIGYQLPAGYTVATVGTTQHIDAVAQIAQTKQLEAPSGDIEKAFQIVEGASDHIVQELYASDGRPTEISLNLAAGLRLVLMWKPVRSSLETWNSFESLAPMSHTCWR